MDMGLPRDDVLILAEDLETAQYFDAVLAEGAPAKLAVNWIVGDVMAHCKVSPFCLNQNCHSLSWQSGHPHDARRSTILGQSLPAQVPARQILTAVWVTIT